MRGLRVRTEEMRTSGGTSSITGPHVLRAFSPLELSLTPCAKVYNKPHTAL